MSISNLTQSNQFNLHSDHATVHGSFCNSIVDTLIDYTVVGETAIICAVNDLTITLPSAVGAKGRFLIVKNSNATNTSIVSAAGLIHGQSTYTLIAEYDSIHVVSDDVDWLLIASNELNQEHVFKTSAADTVLVYDRTLLDAVPLINPTPVSTIGTAGTTAQSVAFDIGQDAGALSAPLDRSLIYCIGSTELASDIDMRQNTMQASILALLGWCCGDGAFDYATGNSSKTSFASWKMNFSSSEGTGATSSTTVVDDGWYFIYLRQGASRNLAGKITNGSNIINYDGNQSAYSVRGGTGDSDVFVLPLYALAGTTIEVEMWTSGVGQNDSGFFLGVRKISNLKPVSIVDTYVRYDSTALTTARKSNTLKMMYKSVERLWRLYGGSCQIISLPGYQYNMPGSAILESSNQTGILNSQWIDLILS